jgi:hypothetical protein
MVRNVSNRLSQKEGRKGRGRTREGRMKVKRIKE